MEYLPVRVSTLRGDQKIDFDCYLKIGDKHILYLRRGDSFEGLRLNRLKEKKLRKMFILPGDETNYQSYLERNIEMAYDAKSGKELSTRAEITQGQQQSNVEEVFENPADEKAYIQTKDAADKFMRFLTSEDQALGAVLGIANVDASIAHHGVTVSSLAVALAQSLGTFDTRQRSTLALGGLLHDFGHFNSILDIARPIKSMDADDLKSYHEHPAKGSAAVTDKKHFEQSIINIIVQHEEKINGKGFPRGLVEKQIDPLALVISSANALDRLIAFEKTSKKDAVKRLMIEQVGEYPLTHIQKLADIINTLPK
ncbi:MAG: HD-GYP domain-containing protein [Pseudobdellovibrionaceae bacterium]